MLNDPAPQHNSILTSELYYHELIYTLNGARFLNAARNGLSFDSYQI